MTEAVENTRAKIAIYIPAYNAALTLPSVLERIPKDVMDEVAEILVVDNNSSDDTFAVAQSYQKKNEKLNIIRNEKNMGYGGSQKIAYQYFIDKNYDYVAMLHGDAQYAPELLGSLINFSIRNKFGITFGSRMRGAPLKGGMPIHRYLGNRFLTSIQNFFLSTSLSEFHSGYRIYSLAELKNIPFQVLASDYHFDTEILILFLHYKMEIGESPIPTYYGEEENYVNIYQYGINVLVTTITYYLHIKNLRFSKPWNQILSAGEQP
jgi:glycosyltransferase involved in cell wall biosynthesis